MEKLIKSLFLEYPVPQVLSVWGAENSLIGVSLPQLIEITLDELSTDLELYETVQATGIQTQLPENTRAVTAVKLVMPFQGNRYVKWSFDTDTKVCMVRYIPAKITYKRPVEVKDLSTLKGSRLTYLKSAIFDRMATKEITYLTTVVLESDAGGINIDALREFRDEKRKIVESMKDDIMLYSNG